jgi:DNA-directed RNA polymerase specialized sigma24 family protein
MAHPGRPRKDVSAEAVAALRAHGLSWREIASVLGVGAGTVRRAYQRVAKTVPKLSLRAARK